MYEAAVSETFDPKRERKAAPGANKEPRRLPEKDGDTPSGDASHATREHEHASERLTGRIDGVQDAELEDEDEADEGKGIAADKEEGRPNHGTV